MVGYFEEPLRKLAPLDQRARAPPAAVFHLFIGQNGHIHRIPIDHGVFPIDKIFLQKIEKQRLLLPIIFRIAGGKFARPVDRQAKRLHLRAHIGDIAIGPIFGVAAYCHRGVFSRHSKRIPAHRVQHIMPGADFMAGNHIAHCVIAHMAHMDPPRRIGKHLKHVIFWFALIACGREDASVFPALLPFRFYFTRLIAHLFGIPCKHFCWYGDSGFGAQRPEPRWAFSQWLVRVSAGFAHRAVAARKGTQDGDMQCRTGLANCGIPASD